MSDKLKPTKKNWYVLATKPKAEKQISKRLNEINIENYLPLHKQLRIWHDRKKWVEIPLFNSYLFVYIEDKYRGKVFEVGGILKYVSVAKKAAILSEDEIERIKKICSYLGEVEIEKSNIRVGEEVEIISGHFSGMRGQVDTIGSKYRFSISIPGLGSYVNVIIDEDYIKKI